MVPPTIRVLFALPAAGFLAGCGPGTLGHSTDVEIRRELAAPDGLARLRIDIVLGAVTIEPGPAGRVSVDGIVHRAADTEEGLARLLRVACEPRLVPGAEPGGFELDLGRLPPELRTRSHALVFKGLLHVPADVAVDVRTERGHLAVVGRNAEVRLRTGSGELRIEDVAADAVLSTGKGGCLIVGHRGGLEATSGSGTILAYVEELAPAGVRLDSRELSIICQLPRDRGFALDAVIDRCAGVDDLVNAFGVPVERAGEGARAVGEVGGGGPPVVLRMGLGNVSVSASETPAGSSGK